ncbi:MAG: endolytic transglycosylase MltG [Actinomycetota bacterium]|nr:endolytic transglycosylase MltG [Actinomycetota bacterium]
MKTDSDQDRPLRTKLLLVGGSVIAGVIVLVLAADFVANMVSSTDSNPGVDPGIPVTVAIQPGSSATSIYTALDEAHVVSYGAIEQAARDADAEGILQAGTYDFVTGMDPGEVLRLLIEGGTSVDARTITVVEGWTVEQITDELAERTEFTPNDFRTALESGAVTSPLLDLAPTSVSELQRWEGLLYPAKYQIPAGSSAAAMLQNMADEMVVRFEAVDWASIEDLGISRYEALVVGSLIEWESGTDADRPLISSVIHNRLAVPMRLQIDATVIYALGENPGQVLASHLEIDSPYNTYRVDGLPPTPIGTVSAVSLKAAINPGSTTFLFYVLSSTDGSHAFADTYEEHQANVIASKEAGILP